MKRILMVLLVLVLTISFCACSTNSKNEKNSNTDGKVDTNTQGDSGVISMSDLMPYTDFREGFIFVTRKSDRRICCINKKGELQFELSNSRGSYYEPENWLNSGFYNGLAIVNLYDEDFMIADEHLCKTDGTIVKPEDVGCDDFLLSPSSISQANVQLFSDGYILASSGKKMGVLNSDFEWIKPLSEEMYSTIQNYISENTEDDTASFYYGQDMFLSPKGYVNIITGETGKIEEVEASLKHPSDFWVFACGDGSVRFKNELYEDWRDALDLSHLYGDYIKGLDYEQRGETLPAFGFDDGVADVLLNVNGQHIFSLVNEKGEQILSPTQVKGDTCCYDNITKVYCVYGQDQNGELVIELFNTQGKINEYTYSVPDHAEYAGVSYEDGVIMICVRYDKNGETEYDWKFFDSNFKLLY